MNKILISLLVAILTIQTYNVYRKQEVIDEILDLAEEAVSINVQWSKLAQRQELQIKKLKDNQCSTWSS